MRLEEDHIKQICRSTVLHGWEDSENVFPVFLPSFSRDVQRKNEEWLDGVQKEAKGAGRNKAKGEALMRRFLMEEPLLGARALGMDTLQQFMEEMKSFQAQCREFDPDITQEAMFQAFRNYSVYAVFLMMNGMEQHCHRAILAYSLLYPHTDNVLDGKDYSRQQKDGLNRLILGMLNGQAMEARTPEQMNTARLLTMLDEVYPYEQNRTLYDSLLLIYDAQVASQRQQNPSEALAVSDILALSIYKGGASVLADRCLMPKPLKETELSFYLGFGFFLQLCDDLQDIGEDTAAQSLTLFTAAADCSQREFYVNRMFHYLEDLFAIHRPLFDGNDATVAFLQKNCHTLITSTVLSVPQYFSQDYVNQMEACFPVTAAYLDKQSRYIRSTLLPMILSMSDQVNPPW